MNKIFRNKHKATLVYTGNKYGSNFNIKDITKNEHKHDLVIVKNALKRHITRFARVRQEED